MRQAEPLFHEEQRFRQLRLRLLLALPPAALTLLVVWQVILGHPWGKQPMSNGGLVGLTVFLWLVYLRLITIRLVTDVSENELAVGLRGLWRQQRIPLSRVQSAKVMVFDALRDFGGYGVRTGRWGKAYVTGGNKGVRVEVSDGSVLIIGSERPDVLAVRLSRAQKPT